MGREAAAVSGSWSQNVQVVLDCNPRMWHLTAVQSLSLVASHMKKRTFRGTHTFHMSLPAAELAAPRKNALYADLDVKVPDGSHLQVTKSSTPVVN